MEIVWLFLTFRHHQPIILCNIVLQRLWMKSGGEQMHSCVCEGIIQKIKGIQIFFSPAPLWIIHSGGYLPTKTPHSVQCNITKTLLIFSDICNMLSNHCLRLWWMYTHLWIYHLYKLIQLVFTKSGNSEGSQKFNMIQYNSIFQCWTLPPPLIVVSMETPSPITLKSI